MGVHRGHIHRIKTKIGYTAGICNPRYLDTKVKQMFKLMTCLDYGEIINKGPVPQC